MVVSPNRERFTALRRAHSPRETKATPVRTYTPKPGDVEKNWYVIDATDVVLGRLAAQAATLLRGKHKPQFAPNEDCGDYVVIINADKVALTNGKADKKFAYRHSGHPGGLTARPHPGRGVHRRAVRPTAPDRGRRTPGPAFSRRRVAGCRLAPEPGTRRSVHEKAPDCR